MSVEEIVSGWEHKSKKEMIKKLNNEREKEKLKEKEKDMER